MGYRTLGGQAARIAAATLLAAGFLTAPAAAAPQCERIDEAGNSYTLCIVDLREDALRLFWLDDDGQPFRTFARLGEVLEAGGADLTFAMNAGMYDADYGPIGLYIEEGAELKAANTNEGPGNFHLLPNGVFYWSEETAGILETNRFVAERPEADFATQSGPMLLIDGAVHPRFLPDSDSRKIRNGVGIIDEHNVAFVLSENAVTFWEFALMFRDRLGVRDALFLDGSVSEIYAPELNRRGLGWFGPILGVVER